MVLQWLRSLQNGRTGSRIRSAGAGQIPAPAPLPFAEGLFLPGILVGRVGPVGLVGPVRRNNPGKRIGGAGEVGIPRYPCCRPVRFVGFVRFVRFVRFRCRLVRFVRSVFPPPHTQKKTGALENQCACRVKKRFAPRYFPALLNAVSSPRGALTAVFGMGTGVTPPVEARTKNGQPERKMNSSPRK